MECECPFSDRFEGTKDCPYLRVKHVARYICDEIEVNPRNSDAWCSLQIEKWLAVIEIFDRME